MGLMSRLNLKTFARPSHQIDSVRALVLDMLVFADSRPLMPVPTAAPLNPFRSVGRRKHDTTDGKPPGLSIQRSRDLLRSIDTAHVVGLSDRTLLGGLAWTGDRIGAVARFRRADLEDQGPRPVLRFREKCGKQRKIPVRHDRKCWLGEYLAGHANPRTTQIHDRRRRRVTRNIVERQFGASL